MTSGGTTSRRGSAGSPSYFLGKPKMATIEIMQNPGGNGAAFYKYNDGEEGFIKQVSESDLNLFNEFEIIPDLRNFIEEVEIL